MPTLFLIDANSLIHRAYHALPPFTAPDGRPTGALYGLSNMLLRLLREEEPAYAAACFDRPEPTFRKAAYAEYKAHRPPTPNELISQLREAHHLFRVFGIRTLEQPGFEADDIIATLAEKFNGGKNKVVILTGDLDTLQLVRDKSIVVRVPRKGVSDTLTYDAAQIKERYGLRPEQMPDYKALVGDSSDNIPGVRGVGPKTASAALLEFGSLEAIFKDPDKDRKLADKILPHRKQAEENRRLVELRRDAPLPIRELSELELAEDKDKLKEYFMELGFKAILARLEGGSKKNTSRTSGGGKKDVAQGAMFG